MELAAFIELISTLGFPIALVVAMGLFVLKIYKDSTANSKDREDKLYNCIAECREINKVALETLALYSERLGVIEADIKDIKDILATKD